MPPKKKVAALVKVALQAGSATPAPPVGTALGPHGVNIMEFVKAYNAATESQRGNVIPVEITVYEDRTFTFITTTPPAGARDRHDEAAGPQRQRRRGRLQDRGGHRPLHGRHRRVTHPLAGSPLPHQNWWISLRG